MNKHPLLDQMRAARDAREDAIADPYRAELSAAGRMTESLARRLRDIEAFMGTEIAKHVADRVGNEMGGKVWQLVCEAAMKAPRSAHGFTVTFPRVVMAQLDPRSLENEILARYRSDALPRLSLSVTRGMDELTIMDIRVPQLGYRTEVTRL